MKDCPWPVDERFIVDEAPGRAPSRVFRALETALQNDDIEVIQDIVRRRPDAVLELNQYGCPPLMFAKSERAVRLLLPFSNPNQADDDGGTALGYMASAGALEAVRALDGLADPVQADGFGVTPLMSAARDGKFAVVEHLAKLGAPLAKAKDGRTALMFACQANCLGSAKALIDASEVEAIDSKGMDALMHAARSSKFDYARSAAGAGIARLLAPKVSMASASRVDAEGKSAFEHAYCAAKTSKAAREAAWVILEAMDCAAKDAQGRSVIDRVRALADSEDGEWIAKMEAKALSMSAAIVAAEHASAKPLRI